MFVVNGEMLYLGKVICQVRILIYILYKTSLGGLFQIIFLRIIMKSIIEFGAIFAVGILNHMVGSFFHVNRPDYQKSFTATENLLRYWLSSICGIMVVLLVAINQPNGLASVGIPTGQNAINDSKTPVIIGLVSISTLGIGMVGIQKLVNYFRKTTPENKIDSSNPAVTETLQYQSTLERLAHLTVLPFVVISEDLIYRGYLVFMLGNKTNIYLPWIILSVIFSVIIHLYQGRKVEYMLYQAAFALLFIGLIIWTGNILAPIAAHLYYDILWAWKIWRNDKKTETKSVKHSKSKIFAYSVFIATNLLLLCIAILAAFSFAG